jgi:hypothetical protein
MPSMLDEAELDARWRGGLEAAAAPGHAAMVESRVAHRLARRRRTRIGVAAGALAMVGILVGGVVISMGGSDTTRVRTAARTGGAAVGAVIDGRPPGVARSWDAVVEFQAPDLARRSVVGRRIAVVLEALGPGTWRLRIDDVPGSSIPVHGENRLNTVSTRYFDLEPGVHPITLTGAPRDGLERTRHTLLEVAAPPVEPAGVPVASVSVVATPELTLRAMPLTVPAGVIEIEYSTEGGTHTLVIDGAPGFRLAVPNGDSLKQIGRVRLAPGEYLLHCVIPGHEEAGERVTLTVT